MATKVGVVRFPGTNCEFDTVEAINALGGQGEILWHGDDSIGDVDAVIIAGGFAHGDYLRPCLLYTSPSPRDATLSRMPSSA